MPTDRAATTWRAPGRVNLIGEHTDYNAGLALPFAIEQGCTATVERADADEVVVTSRQRDEPVTAARVDLEATPEGWARYPIGVRPAWSSIVARAARRSSANSSGVWVCTGRWASPWQAISWPAAAIRPTSPGWARAAIPSTKNVARA